jgi:hypothetical protein
MWMIGPVTTVKRICVKIEQLAMSIKQPSTKTSVDISTPSFRLSSKSTGRGDHLRIGARSSLSERLAGRSTRVRWPMFSMSSSHLGNADPVRAEDEEGKDEGVDARHGR